MSNLFPYTFQATGNKFLFSNDAGDFFLSSEQFLDRLVKGRLTNTDNHYLLRKGFAFNEEHDFYYNSYLSKIKQKKYIREKLSYIIVIPTLRCDLACDYCQVSRASLGAKGFDWTDEITQAFKTFLSAHSDTKIKIEFQGGEPSLRMDIIEEVVAHCDKEGLNADFIICTNLNTLPEALRKLLDRSDFFVSTSIDGPAELHTNNRTKNEHTTSSVLENYGKIQRECGADK
ncbi:MAG: radical SAM protein [Robiginitomaculum sp.]|nr:radical SAM protein [Robiginitomaculum sp.]